MTGTANRTLTGRPRCWPGVNLLSRTALSAASDRRSFGLRSTTGSTTFPRSSTTNWTTTWPSMPGPARELGVLDPALETGQAAHQLRLDLGDLEDLRLGRLGLRRRRGRRRGRVRRRRRRGRRGRGRGRRRGRLGEVELDVLEDFLLDLDVVRDLLRRRGGRRRRRRRLDLLGLLDVLELDDLLGVVHHHDVVPTGERDGEGGDHQGEREQQPDLEVDRVLPLEIGFGRLVEGHIGRVRGGPSPASTEGRPVGASVRVRRRKRASGLRVHRHRASAGVARLGRAVAEAEGAAPL